MPSIRLNIDEFFQRLGDLFRSRPGMGHGSIFLTQKRLDNVESAASRSQSKSGVTDSLSDLGQPSPFSILIRATNGSRHVDKEKFSVVVKPEEIEEFYVRYTEVCKAGMQGLRKRDKSKKKKARAKKRKEGDAVRKA